jgi:hypothetical protein
MLCRVYLKCTDKLWARVPHTKTRKYVRINTCPETLSAQNGLHVDKDADVSPRQVGEELNVSHIRTYTKKIIYFLFFYILLREYN